RRVGSAEDIVVTVSSPFCRIHFVPQHRRVTRPQPSTPPHRTYTELTCLLAHGNGSPLQAPRNSGRTGRFPPPGGAKRRDPAGVYWHPCRGEARVPGRETGPVT